VTTRVTVAITVLVLAILFGWWRERRAAREAEAVEKVIQGLGEKI
jgi:hypothetical protein